MLVVFLFLRDLDLHQKVYVDFVHKQSRYKFITTVTRKMVDGELLLFP